MHYVPAHLGNSTCVQGLQRVAHTYLILRSMKKVQGRCRLMWSMGASGCSSIILAA